MTTDVRHAGARSATESVRGAPVGRAPTRFAGLDGLRAIAVLTVIVFHLNPDWLPGGFLGVDIFFVISGFLITSLLIREHQRTGAIDLPGFWTRRARRLLPALLACVLVSTLLAALVQRDLLVGIARQTVGALTFTSNWLEIAAGSDYFHATSPQLFMNLWSLAVEEQFYLLWPLATLLLLRQVRHAGVRERIPLAIGIISVLLMAILLDPEAATRVYYGTDTHLVGLMLGATLAFAYAAPHRAWTTTPFWQRWRTRIVPGAALVLVLLMLFLGESAALTFRGGIALASVATAIILLAVVTRPGPLRTFLDSPLLSWVGQRSYGIYLWHWPVILLLDQLWRTIPGTSGFAANRALALGLTLALAQASYRWLETPVRRHGFRACTATALSWFTGASIRRLRWGRATLAFVLGAWLVILATAPAHTSTEELLRRNAALTASTSEVPAGGAPGSGTSSGSADAPKAPSPAAAVPGATPLKAGARQASFSMPTGSEIDVFGDSMVIGSIPALQYWFPGIRVDARSNTRWSHGLTQVRARGHDLRRVVVLGYGTNAGVEPQVVAQVLATAGPKRMVVLVTEHGPFSRVKDDNVTLREIAAAHPNVVIADWDGALRGTSGQLQPDGIHPSLTGQHLWARTVWDGLAALVKQHTGVTVPTPDKPIP